MTQFVRAASLPELPPGSRLAVWVSGIRVMLANVGGTIFAVDEQCTHMQCSMLNGPLQGTVLVCPCHLAAFDLSSGRVLKGPATVDLPTYQVKIEGRDIMVEEKPAEIV
jgi:3-phenylpropionate/trans-cinnamate dioxygenase ferredoxin component